MSQIYGYAGTWVDVVRIFGNQLQLMAINQTQVQVWPIAFKLLKNETYARDLIKEFVNNGAIEVATNQHNLKENTYHIHQHNIEMLLEWN